MLLSYFKSLLNPRPRPTWDEVLAEYLQSSDFRDLSAASKKPYRRVLEKWLREEPGLGAQPVAALTRRELEAMLSRRSQGAANFLFKRVRVLLRFAIAQGHRDDDPTIGIKCKPIGNEHATWTDGEIEQYRDHWRLGTRERLAFELALCTSQRRTDLARMRWDHIRHGRLAVRQSKTKVSLSLPIHPDLQAALAAMRGRREGPLLARTGRPAGRQLTPESLGTLFAEWIEEAGLGAHCVLHGLRKACCRRLAEMGCSEKEIASVSGHKTLAEVARYTKAASQERLSTLAMARIAGDAGGAGGVGG
jgi:integrase